MNDFLDFCRQRGIIINDLPPIGIWRRYPTADKGAGHKNGAVKWLGDCGHVQNHATMTEVETWHADKDSPDYVQSPALLARIEASKEADRQKRQDGIKGARMMWSRSKRLLGGHPYLTNKGLSMLGCTGLRTYNDLLVIPMHRGESLMSTQTIDSDGEKKFFYGAPTKGCYYALSRQRAAVTCFAEGLATALAIFQSIEQANVICCFNSGNILEVAKFMKPTGSVVFCADNDHGTFEKRGFNPGIDAARNAAELVGGGIAYPTDVFGSITDWADVLKERGLSGKKYLSREILKQAQYVA